MGVAGHGRTAACDLVSDFDPRTYGFKKLSDLVRNMEALELATEVGTARVRLRPKTSKAKKSTS